MPKYDFNWQTEYMFAEPLKLPKGSKLHAVAHYDNSRPTRPIPIPRRTWPGATRRGKR